MPLALVVLVPRKPEFRVAIAEGRTYAVGRGAECDIAVDDQRVSSRHATIEGDGEGFRIVDERSRNGTFVNGRTVSLGERIALKVGDEIRLGESVLRVAPASALDAVAGNEENTRPVAGAARTERAAEAATPPGPGEFRRRAEQLRSALDARIASGASDPVGHLLPARLKDYFGFFGTESGGAAELDGETAAELRAALEASFSAESSNAVHVLVAEVSGLLIDALSGKRPEDAGCRRLAEVHGPTLLADEFFNDSLRRQILELMGEILVRRGHLADDEAMRRAVEGIDREAALGAGALLDMQTCRLRGFDPGLGAEEPGPPRNDLAMAVAYWAATSSFCRYLFKRWGWLAGDDRNFAMPARSNEIEEVRDNSRGLYEEWKDGLAPQGLAAVRRDTAGLRYSFADMPVAVVGPAGAGRTALLRATREELLRARSAEGGFRLRPLGEEGDRLRLAIGEDSMAPERRPVVCAADVCLEGAGGDLPEELAAARGLLFVVDDRCFATGAGERPRIDPGAVAEDFAATLRKFRERNPRAHHVPVGLVVTKIDAILGEEVRALPRSYLVPGNASLSVLQAGISARNLPSTPYERLWTSVAGDLSLNRHPKIQRLVRGVLWHFRPFAAELIDFTYRYQFFLAAATTTPTFGAAEPLRWIAAKLYGPHLRQARLALVAESQEMEAACSRIRTRLETLGPLAERLRGLEARLAEANEPTGRKVLPFPGAKARADAIARQASEAEAEFRGTLAKAERDADLGPADESLHWKLRLGRLSDRLMAMTARREELDAWAEQTREMYSNFHPVGMTTLYWS